MARQRIPLVKRTPRRSTLREKLLQEWILEAKIEWESTVDTLTELVGLMDGQCRFLRCNRTVEAWGLGSVKKVKGVSLHRLLHPSCASPSCYLLRFEGQLREQGVSSALKWEGYDPVLNRYGSLRVYPIRRSRRKAVRRHYVFVFADISEEYKLREELSQRNRVLTTLNELVTRSYTGTLREILGEFFARVATILPLRAVLLLYEEPPQYPQLFLWEEGKVLPPEDLYRFPDGEEILTRFQEDPDSLPQGLLEEEVPYYSILYRTPYPCYMMALLKERPDQVFLDLIGIVCSTLKDILAHLEMERARQEYRALEMMNLFAGQTAHDIRNYLTSLNFFLELLRKEALPPDLEEFARRVQTQAKRVQRLVSDLLALSTPFRHEKVEDYPPGVVLEGALRSWEEAHPGARIKREWAGLEGVVLRCDRLRVEQAIHNLLENAFEAAPEGEIVVRARLGPKQELFIEIEDQGPGISPEVLPRLFTPFFTTKTKGTGLGLTVVKRIVEHHGGHVELRNRPHPPGCLALITLPLQAGAPS